VRIESIDLSETRVYPGDAVTGRIVTTSNAASVTAQAGTIVLPVPKIAPGIFALTLQVPRLAVGVRQMDIVVKAVRTDGAFDQRTVSVMVE